MAKINFPNVKIVGMSACVPKFVDENINSELMSEKEIQNLIATTGIERKRIADDSTTSSDLCYKAAEKLIEDLNWSREEIGCLIFVSQTPDYILPATSCILQDRLGLGKDCITLDISLGCSGYVYGLSTIAGYLASGSVKKALLLVGDTTSKTTSSKDKTSWPLFGDAGTATALEYSKDHEGMFFHLGSDGKGAQAIVIPDGGYRNGVHSDTLEMKQYENGVERNNLHCILDGMDVFSFAITQAPKSIKNVLEFVNKDTSEIDYFVMHQANLFLNETIRKKIKVDNEKVPYSLKNFGNTSCATIPLTLVTEKQNDLRTKALKIVGCGFGVGLSWGSVYFETDKIICSDLVEY